MNTMVILALAAVTTTALALVHESCLRRAAHNVLRRLVQSYCRTDKDRDQTRDSK